MDSINLIDRIGLIFTLEEASGFSSYLDSNVPYQYENALKEVQDALESKNPDIYTHTCIDFVNLFLGHLNDFCALSGKSIREINKKINDIQSINYELPVELVMKHRLSSLVAMSQKSNME